MLNDSELNVFEKHCTQSLASYDRISINYLVPCDRSAMCRRGRVSKCVLVLLALLMCVVGRVAAQGGVEVNFLLLKVLPTHAAVIIDNEYKPLKSDGTVSLLLTKGTHTYQVQAPGYVTDTGVVEIGDTKVTKNVELALSTYTITLSISMADADLYLNGEWVGKGLWKGPALPGSYKAEARKAGYRPSLKSFEITKEQSLCIELDSLEPLYGRLSIDSDPSECEIRLDGTVMGITPDILPRVAVGRHQIQLLREGYVTYTSDVEVKESETASVMGVLTRNDRTLTTGNGDGTSEDAYVDLGLPSGLLWATCNVGAEKPEDYGDYFAWGETIAKSDYSWSTLKYCNDKAGESFSKYVTKSSYGTVDNKTVLESSDDAAVANCGDGGRMPTHAEWEELFDNCIWTWTEMEGHNGCKVTSKRNGRFIFLPAAGRREDESVDDAGSMGYYWTSTLHGKYMYSAWCSYFDESRTYPSYYDYYSRYYGFSIRPVAR